jgi:hypothetical protein
MPFKEGYRGSLIPDWIEILDGKGRVTH